MPLFGEQHRDTDRDTDLKDLKKHLEDIYTLLCDKKVTISDEIKESISSRLRYISTALEYMTLDLEAGDREKSFLRDVIENDNGSDNFI